MALCLLPGGYACPFSPPGFSLGRRCCKVPSRVRSRSAENAAVLTLHRTQRKDWRFQTPLPGILAAPPPQGKTGWGKRAGITTGQQAQGHE
ncbi:hypothetical protein DXA36_07895 [Eisenbergiella sp. OF01-20]|nr:hypothetical protein DXA36_07895 [Eisenbergiella sp. OF01-20]